MNMFSGDKYIYGEGARIIKKYSKSQDAEAEEWKLSNCDGGHESFKLFDSFIDCLYTATALGFLRNKKANVGDFDKKYRATIFAGAWMTRQMDFTRLYRLMVLTDKSINLSKDDRIKKISSEYSSDVENSEFNYFLEYSYGGLLELDSILTDIHDYNGLANFVSSIFSELCELQATEKDE